MAAAGTGNIFGKGRELAAWLGMVPRQITAGGKAKLICLSKHGDRYLRKLFIHRAGAVLYLVRDRSSPITRWADGLKKRAHVNVAAVEMANKMARIAWAVLSMSERYHPSALVGTRTCWDVTRNIGICERGEDGPTTKRRLISLIGSMTNVCR